MSELAAKNCYNGQWLQKMAANYGFKVGNNKSRMDSNNGCKDKMEKIFYYSQNQKELLFPFFRKSYYSRFCVPFPDDNEYGKEDNGFSSNPNKSTKKLFIT